jgi:hypothetical protein
MRRSLTPEQVDHIRRAFLLDGVPQIRLAEQYGVDQPVIRSAIFMETYRDVPVFLGYADAVARWKSRRGAGPAGATQAGLTARLTLLKAQRAGLDAQIAQLEQALVL